MTKEINIIRCTCDICKRGWDIKPDTSNPLIPIRLPMGYYDETGIGRYSKNTVAEVEICSICLNKMVEDLEMHYRMRLIANGGVEIERKEDEGK